MKTTLNLIFIILSLSFYAQTIVSTTQENKNVILEEFTGIHCGYCPSGHSIAQGIKNAHPDDVFLINIHTGGYATPSGNEPDFRTSFGSSIASQSALIGYPAGTVNRHFFSGLAMTPGGTAMGRSQWTNASNQILAQSSYLNVGVESSVNVSTRELTVHVEVYYTGNSPISTNKLNVALLQDNTLGYQSGGNMGNNYNHRHRLVHLITGQWGETISNTTTGSFIDRTFTYTIPEFYNNVSIELDDLKIVAFVAQTQQEIISGNESDINLIYPYSSDQNLRYIKPIEPLCNVNQISPMVYLGNSGADPLTSVDIMYSVNSGTPLTYHWTGNLAGSQSEWIQLPNITFDLLNTNYLDVFLNNDSNNANNSKSIVFYKIVAQPNVSLVINTDNYGEECSWNIKDANGNIVQSGGYYGNNNQYSYNFTLPGEGCYTFNLIDSYGDGGGAVSLTSGSTIIYSTTGSYGSGVSRNFEISNTAGNNDNILSSVKFYPNPVEDVINIINLEVSNINYNISDNQGRIVAQGIINYNNDSINISNLEQGTYFIKINNENVSKIEKIIIK
jgi:hypothetical protein